MNQQANQLRERIGTMNKNFVWLFAFGAVLLSVASGFVTSGMSGAVASAVYFGIFAVSGFFAVALTESKVGMAALAFVLASLTSAAGYYLVISSTTQEAVETLGAAGETGVVGAFVGAFFAVVIAIGTLVSGIGGVVAGGRFRKKALAA